MMSEKENKTLKTCWYLHYSKKATYNQWTEEYLFEEAASGLCTKSCVICVPIKLWTNWNRNIKIDQRKLIKKMWHNSSKWKLTENLRDNVLIEQLPGSSLFLAELCQESLKYLFLLMFSSVFVCIISKQKVNKSERFCFRYMLILHDRDLDKYEFDKII